MTTYQVDVSPKTSLEHMLSGEHEMFPVREIVASRAFVRGMVASQRNNKALDAESLLEQDFCTLLEFDSRVRRYGMQPFTIRWTDANGARRQYTPDVLVHYDLMLRPGEVRQRPTVYEVKHSEDLRENWVTYRPKFKAAIAALRPLGLTFKIITEKQIRTPRLKNASFLLQYATPRLSSPEPAENEMKFVLRRRLFVLKVSTPRELLASISSSTAVQARYLPWLWHLIAYGLAGCDLDKPLNMSSPVWTFDDERSVRSNGMQHFPQPWPKLLKSARV